MEDKKGSGEKIKVDGGRKEVAGDKKKKRRWKKRGTSNRLRIEDGDNEED